MITKINHGFYFFLGTLERSLTDFTVKPYHRSKDVKKLLKEVKKMTVIGEEKFYNRDNLSIERENSDTASRGIIYSNLFVQPKI